VEVIPVSDLVDQVKSMRRELRALKTGGNLSLGQLGYVRADMQLVVPNGTTTFNFSAFGILDGVTPFAMVAPDASMFDPSCSVAGTRFTQSGNILQIAVDIACTKSGGVTTTLSIIGLGCNDIEMGV
jgi:hypothetical protein